jgi:predicted transcriptional regulator
MVGRGEFMDIHEAWVKGKSVSEIARVTGRDRKTIRRLLQGGARAERKPRQVTSKLDRFREYLLARMLGEDPVTKSFAYPIGGFDLIARGQCVPAHGSIVRRHWGRCAQA